MKILKKMALGLALAGSLLAIGCSKGGDKDNGQQSATQAREAFNNCIARNRQYWGQGAEASCYQVRGQYACSISEYFYGQCYGVYNQGSYRPANYNYNYYQWGYYPTQGYMPQQPMPQQPGQPQGAPTLDGYFVYLAQFPAQEIDYMISAWNRGGY